MSKDRSETLVDRGQPCDSFRLTRGGSLSFASVLWPFDTTGFPARWYCGTAWGQEPWLGWLHVVADIVIWFAYMSIPIVLAYFVLRKRDVPFPRIMWLFCAFIAACGTGHLLEAVIFWVPMYRMAGFVKLVTAIVSLATVVALIRIAPLALKLPGLAQMNEQLRRTEEVLRENEARFRSLIEQSIVGFYVLQNDRFTYVNPRLSEILGFSANELTSRAALDFIAEEDHSVAAENILRRVNDTNQSIRFPLRMRRSDGQILQTEVHDTTTERSGTRSIFGVLMDVTEQRQAEEDRNRFFGISRDLFYITDFDSRFKRLNPAWETTLGWDVDELLGQSCLNLIHPDDCELVRRDWEVLIAGEQSTFGRELRFHCKDGSYKWVRWNAVADLRQRLVYATASDLTEPKRLEKNARDRLAELAHAGRLSAVGEMLSGLAHEINQPLAAAANYARACVRFAKSNQDVTKEQLQEWMEKAAAQSDRASQIVKRLSAFMKKDRSVRSEVDINQLVENIIGLPALLGLPYGVNDPTVSLLLEKNLPLFFVDKVQIEQVLVNLIRNAIDSMVGLSQNERRLVVKTQRDAELIRVSVSDIGHGISTEHRAQLFSPFFTTKEDGMGLGLSISRSIIEAHDGQMFVESEPERGTTISFALPIRSQI